MVPMILSGFHPQNVYSEYCLGLHMNVLGNHDDVTKWKHFPALLTLCAGNSPVNGEFRAQRPVTGSFDVFFGQRLNKRLRKQSWGWWFESPWRSLWRHCNVIKTVYLIILHVNVKQNPPRMNISGTGHPSEYGFLTLMFLMCMMSQLKYHLTMINRECSNANPIGYLEFYMDRDCLKGQNQLSAMCWL